MCPKTIVFMQSDQEPSLTRGNALLLRGPVARYPHQTRDSPRKSEQTDLEEQKMSQNHRKKGVFPFRR